jgi:hypothetical protein
MLLSNSLCKMRYYRLNILLVTNIRILIKLIYNYKLVFFFQRITSLTSTENFKNLLKKKKKKKILVKINSLKNFVYFFSFNKL